MSARHRHAGLAQQVVAAAIAAGWRAGRHVTEEGTAQLLDVSRTPARSALAVLAERGVLTRMPHRGYRLVHDAVALRSLAIASEEPPDELLRRLIIGDRLALRLDHEVSQASLARRYGVGMPTLQRVFRRMEQEGLVDRVGWRWRFVPTLETGQSRRASYELRLMVEPAALLLAGFAADPAPLQRLIDEHATLLSAPETPRHDPLWIFELDCRFHETLAAFSGNPFVLATVRQHNALRRLLELASYVDEVRISAWCAEHLAILRCLHAGNPGQASHLLHTHLTTAATAGGVVGLGEGST
jgi:DNA-binding GntR family transcriptional regulator